MEDIDFYCKKCRKSMKISYTVMGNNDISVMKGIIIRCHTHKCTRVMTLKNYTEGELIKRTDSRGRCYL